MLTVKIDRNAINVYQLRLPQVRILKALYDSESPLTKPEIAERAKVSKSMTANLGSVRPEINAAIFKKYNKYSLLHLEYVKSIILDIDGKREERFQITKLGRKTFDKLNILDIDGKLEAWTTRKVGHSA